MLGLRRDPWLSNVLGANAFAVDNAMRLDRGGLERSDVDFVWARLPASDETSRSHLQFLGFRTIEGSLTFEQGPRRHGETEACVRDAVPGDEDGVASLAGRSFSFDRFHQDPLIDSAHADRLKSDWVRGYFRGTRGDELLVYESDGTIGGFLLALRSEQNGRVIDLISTAPERRGQGVATALLKSLRDRTEGVIRAGTQFSNLPSVSMYVRHGFSPIKADWTLHFHRV